MGAGVSIMIFFWRRGGDWTFIAVISEIQEMIMD